MIKVLRSKFSSLLFATLTLCITCLSAETAQATTNITGPNSPTNVAPNATSATWQVGLTDPNGTGNPYTSIQFAIKDSTGNNVFKPSLNPVNNQPTCTTTAVALPGPCGISSISVNGVSIGAGALTATANLFAANSASIVLTFSQALSATDVISITSSNWTAPALNDSNRIYRLVVESNNSQPVSPALFTVSSVSYSVTFSDQGTSSSLSTGSQTYVTTPTPSARNGYQFTGWTLAQNGTGPVIQQNVRYTPNSNVTLYGQWTVVNASGSSNSSTELAETGSHTSDSVAIAILLFAAATVLFGLKGRVGKMPRN